MEKTMKTPGQMVELRFAWRSLEGPRVVAHFQAVVEREDPVMRRVFCRLVALKGIQIPPGVKDPLLTPESLRALEKKRVKVPQEALEGLILPLKRETLTGSLWIPYFESSFND
ncbi:MAG: hypothetical protein NZ572_01960 [Thermoflexus sp.]|nr:hypothetical protein [Thermoflexus sp.]